MIEDYKWYVIHTYSGYENKVADNIKKAVENRGLHDQIAEVFIPTEKVTEIKAESEQEEGKPKKNKAKGETERKLFPGYVFVKLAVSYNDRAKEVRMTDEVWYIIRNTRGCTGFVGPEGRPVPLTEDEAVKLGVETYSVDLDYEVGDLVTIVSGSFIGFSGPVQSIDIQGGTVCILISMMGRGTPIELGLDQVEPTIK